MSDTLTVETAVVVPSTVAELAATTKLPVETVFGIFSGDTALREEQIVEAGGVLSLKPGTVRNTLKTLISAGFVSARNAKTGTRGRPPKEFFVAPTPDGAGVNPETSEPTVESLLG